MRIMLFRERTDSPEVLAEVMDTLFAWQKAGKARLLINQEEGLQALIGRSFKEKAGPDKKKEIPEFPM